jgi:hypothetical protein
MMLYVDWISAIALIGKIALWFFLGVSIAAAQSILNESRKEDEE